MSKKDAEDFEIYTDGACSGNPGPGGWAFLVKNGSQIRWRSGYSSGTTNNRMEIFAVIEAFKFVLDQYDSASKKRIILLSDSKYVLDSITKWIHNWKRNGWRSASGEVKNQDLWRTLDELTSALKAKDFQVEWKHVRGHSGDVFNDRVDELAVAASQSQISDEGRE